MTLDFLEAAASFPPLRTLADVEAIEQTPWASYALPQSTIAMIEASGARHPEATALRFLIVPGTMARVAATGMRHLPDVFRAAADRTVKKALMGLPLLWTRSSFMFGCRDPLTVSA